jgi:hypothetical protein
MIVYSGDLRVDKLKGTTPISGKPEELDWLAQQFGDSKDFKRNTKNTATAPLEKMKEMARKFPDRIKATL